VGVPEITQVDAATLSPVGKAVVPLLIAQAVTLAPLADRVEGVTVMAVPTVPLVPDEAL
jgi:hypothetical protein